MIEERYWACDMADEACLAVYKSPGFQRVMEFVRKAAYAGLFYVDIELDEPDASSIIATLSHIGYSVDKYGGSNRMHISWRKS